LDEPLLLLLELLQSVIEIDREKMERKKIKPNTETLGFNVKNPPI
jgi:hypothetical protein